jgi:hypothetical protein
MQNTEDQDEGCLLLFLKFMGIAIGLSLVAMLLGIVFGGESWLKDFSSSGAHELRVLFWFTVGGAIVIFLFFKQKKSNS